MGSHEKIQVIPGFFLERRVQNGPGGLPGEAGVTPPHVPQDCHHFSSAGMPFAAHRTNLRARGRTRAKKTLERQREIVREAVAGARSVGARSAAVLTDLSEVKQATFCLMRPQESPSMLAGQLSRERGCLEGA